MRALVVIATLFFSVLPTAAAGHPCPEAAPGVFACDNNGDGQADQYAVEMDADGVHASADVAYVDFSGVKVALVGADASAHTPVGNADAFAYSYCVDLDDDVMTCEYTTTFGYATLDTRVVDASLVAIYLDWGELDLGQHMLVVQAAETTSSASLYHYCHEDVSPDGCRSQLVFFNLDAAGTPYGPWALVSREPGSTYACVIAYVGACQGVPAGV